MNTALFSTDDWGRIGELFDRLSALPAGERNLDELDEPPELVDLLSRMLAAHDSDDPQLLDRTVHAVAGHLVADAGAETLVDHAGRRFGPWQAVEEIGRGGMAVVLRGERADGQFEKEVAIKLLPRTGSDSERDRLVEEIRILARLEHSNIARLIDGGIDDQGTPYLVMEYVRGVPINEYCESHELDLKSRIRLFQQVTDAVRFAHQHLIVHCDIKPDNVLVSEEGQVKLIDFGIAGLVTGTEAAARGLLCSPGYCAPEQMNGAPPATSQDIYNLGAVLYELLCRQRIRANDTATRLLFGIRKAVETVPPPSRHQPDLDRDLDAICTKALNNDPEARYSDAESMRLDLENWSRNIPVRARPATIGYRTGKWMRRHWLPASAAFGIFLALITGTTVALWQAHEARLSQYAAEQELERATALNQFVASLFEGARIGMPRDQVPTTRELLLRGVENARRGFRDQPEVQVDMLTLIGSLLNNVGLAGEAREVMADAIDLRLAMDGPDDPRLAEMRLEYGQALHFSDEYDEAIDELHQAVKGLRESGNDQLLAKGLHELGYALSNRLRWDEALDAHFEALDIQRAIDDSEGLGPGLSATARTLQRAGQLEESEQMYEAALARLRADAETSVHVIAGVLSDYGVTLRRLGHYQRAEELLRESIAASETVYTGPHVTMAQRWNNLGSVLTALGDRPAAIEAFAAAMDILEALPGDDVQSILAGPLNNLGFLNMTIGEYEQAETYFRRSLELLEASTGRDHPNHIAVSGNLGRSLSLQGQYDQAESVLEDALARSRQHYSETDGRLTGLLLGLGQVRWQRDRDPEGLALIRQAHDTLTASDTNHTDTARYATELADALVLVPDLEAARELYATALRHSTESLPPLHHQVLGARTGLAETLVRLGERDAAIEVIAPIGELPPPQLAPNDPLRSRLANIHQQLGSAH